MFKLYLWITGSLLHPLKLLLYFRQEFQDVTAGAWRGSQGRFPSPRRAFWLAPLWSTLSWLGHFQMWLICILNYIKSHQINKCKLCASHLPGSGPDPGAEKPGEVSWRENSQHLRFWMNQSTWELCQWLIIKWDMWPRNSDAEGKKRERSCRGRFWKDGFKLNPQTKGNSACGEKKWDSPKRTPGRHSLGAHGEQGDLQKHVHSIGCNVTSLTQPQGLKSLSCRENYPFANLRVNRNPWRERHRAVKNGTIFIRRQRNCSDYWPQD